MMNSMNTMLMPFSSGSRACDCKSPKVHKVPRMPVMIDQQNADPTDVRDLTGTALHTVVDHDAIDGKMLNLFTSKIQAEEFARSIPQRKSSAYALSRREQQRSKLAATSAEAVKTAKSAETAVPPDGGYMELYEHIDFDGCSWRLLEQDNHTVGDYSNLWACGFLWWGWKNANDVVSSMDITVSARFVVFFDAPNLDYGDFTNTLWVPGNSWVPNLVPHGWNDRITSHMLWY